MSLLLVHSFKSSDQNTRKAVFAVVLGIEPEVSALSPTLALFFILYFETGSH